MKIIWYRHFRFRLETGSILIDPFPKGNPMSTFPGRLDPSAGKFVAGMRRENAVVPQVGQAIAV